MDHISNLATPSMSTSVWLALNGFAQGSAHNTLAHDSSSFLTAPAHPYSFTSTSPPLPSHFLQLFSLLVIFYCGLNTIKPYVISILNALIRYSIILLTILGILTFCIDLTPLCRFLISLCHFCNPATIHHSPSSILHPLSIFLLGIMSTLLIGYVWVIGFYYLCKRVALSSGFILCAPTSEHLSPEARIGTNPHALLIIHRTRQ